MINIITGEVNSGKTTKLLDIYKTLGRGDGFFNSRIYDGCNCAGQKIVRLSNGESEVWALKSELPEEWQQVCSYGEYSFSKRGLQFAEEIIYNLLSLGIEPIFIDEIGPLELYDKGFHELFKASLESKKELYIVIRKSILKAVLDKYNITEYQAIHIQRRAADLFSI